MPQNGPILQFSVNHTFTTVEENIEIWLLQMPYNHLILQFSANHTFTMVENCFWNFIWLPIMLTMFNFFSVNHNIFTMVKKDLKFDFLKYPQNSIILCFSVSHTFTMVEENVEICLP